MPFVPVTDVAKVEINMQLDAVPVVNVMHVHQASGWNLTTITALSFVFTNWWAGFYSVDLSAQLELIDVTVTDIGVAGGVQVVQPGGSVGGDSGVSLPANAALVLSWRTGHTGRSFRGRTYAPGIPQHTQIDPQHVDPSEATGLQTAGAQLLTDLATASQDLVVVSYFSGGVARVTPIATPITNCLVNNQLDTQRKRLKQ